MKGLPKLSVSLRPEKKSLFKRRTETVKGTKKWMLLMLLVIVPKIASAQLELYSKFNQDGTADPIIDYFGSKKINDRFALTFFGLVRQEWGQALIGVSYSLKPNLVFYASAGIEEGHSSPRYSSSVWLKQGHTSFLALIEVGEGPGNYLYKVNAFHWFSEKISLGIMDWRYHGIGPNFRYTFTKSKLTLWVMPAYDHEQNTSRCMLGAAIPM